MEEREESPRDSRLTIFIGCSKTKGWAPRKAKELYRGALFCKALKYSLGISPKVFILSAKYGVLALDDIIPPYNQTLMRMKKPEKIRWRQMVLTQIRKRKLFPPFCFLCGSHYHEGLPEGDRPFKGMLFGRILHWLNTQLRKQRGLGL